MKESETKNVKVVCPSPDWRLRDYVKNVVRAVLVVYKQVPADADLILEAYGRLLLEKEYMITVYPKLTAAVKQVHYHLVCDLINASADPYFLHLLKGDPIYLEYEGRTADAEEEVETKDENISEEA